jgi:hypothetical protein
MLARQGFAPRPQARIRAVQVNFGKSRNCVRNLQTSVRLGESAHHTPTPRAAPDEPFPYAEITASIPR